MLYGSQQTRETRSERVAVRHVVLAETSRLLMEGMMTESGSADVFRSKADVGVWGNKPSIGPAVALQLRTRRRNFKPPIAGDM
jgi:hypothetical protein